MNYLLQSKAVNGGIGLMCLFLVLSCSSPPQILDKDKRYRMDMCAEINGEPYCGVVTVPKAAKYVMKIKPRGQLNMILITTCHRDENYTPEPKGGGIFSKSDNTFNYVYSPQPGLEDEYCPLRINAFDKSNRGQHSWMFIDFPTGEEKVKATLACNGELTVEEGISACQSKAGLLQAIRFGEGVRVATDKKCPLPKNEGKEFVFPIKKGECVYAFMNSAGDVHRLTTIGYEGVLIRDDPEKIQQTVFLEGKENVDDNNKRSTKTP